MSFLGILSPLEFFELGYTLLYPPPKYMLFFFRKKLGLALRIGDRDGFFLCCRFEGLSPRIFVCVRAR